LKKQFFALLLLAIALLSARSPACSQDLQSGQQAIFLNTGNRIIGEIIDISSTRLVLQIKSGQEISLSRIWMINFSNKNWYFPEELKRINTPQHYLFLKNDDVILGRVVDFSDRMRVFELEGGGKAEIGKLRRIYFSGVIPKKLAKTLKPKIKKGTPSKKNG
jgi:exosome complex RNA-binding protein Rrp4